MPNRLDPTQEAISKINAGPVLVVSGPGSGKTRVITARAVHLVQNIGVRPERMIVVTFTKAAAEEMKSRISRAVGEEIASTMHIQTIHSLCYEFLARLGYTLNVQDEGQQRQRVGQIIRSLELPEDLIQSYLQERSNGLNRLIPLARYQPASMDREQFGAITQLYQEQQQLEGFMDFDDLLIEMHGRLQALPQLNGRFIMVDEFQDTSLVQYEILKCLAAPTNNIFGVGDDDQSIYSWRGACNAPLQFERDFPQAQRVSLTTNYRSTGQIVSISSALIRNNRNRLRKKLQAETEAASGVRPSFINPQDEKDEARQIAQAIEAGYKEGLPWQDMAIIYRLNNQAFLLGQELIKRSIPFRILGGEPQILNHWISRGLMGYLEAAMYPGHAGLLFYILNRPGRFFSKPVIAAAEILVLEGVSPLEALRQQPISESGMKALAKLESDLTKISTMKAQQALAYVRKEIGFDGFIQGLVRDFKLDYEECQQIADTICYLPDAEESVAEFVRRFPDLRNGSRWAKTSNGVTLTTCHSAKGLEYRYVILAGAVEGTLPYAKALTANDGEKLEEERRLAYVAVTRSEDMLLVSCPKTMRGRSVQPSRFIGEMRQGMLHDAIIEGKSFEHPAWGRCTWGSSDGEIVSVKTPSGDVKRIALAWLQERNVI